MLTLTPTVKVGTITLFFINEEVEAKVVQQDRAGRFATGSAELLRSLAVCRR